MSFTGLGSQQTGTAETSPVRGVAGSRTAWAIDCSRWLAPRDSIGKNANGTQGFPGSDALQPFVVVLISSLAPTHPTAILSQSGMRLAT